MTGISSPLNPTQQRANHAPARAGQGALSNKRLINIDHGCQLQACSLSMTRVCRPQAGLCSNAIISFGHSFACHSKTDSDLAALFCHQDLRTFLPTGPLVFADLVYMLYGQYVPYEIQYFESSRPEPLVSGESFVATKTWVLPVINQHASTQTSRHAIPPCCNPHASSPKHMPDAICCALMEVSLFSR